MKPTRLIALVLFSALSFSLCSESAFAQKIPYIGIGSNAKFNPETGAYSGSGTGIPLKQSVNGYVIPVFDEETDPGVFISGTFTGAQTM